MTIEPANGIGAYDPKTYELRSFFDQRQKFLDTVFTGILSVNAFTLSKLE